VRDGFGPAAAEDRYDLHFIYSPRPWS
jgi:hypothetical protein